MRILYLTPRFPYPPLKGDQVIAYHRLRHLGRRHEITLVSFVEHEDETEARGELEPFCAGIEAIELPAWRSVLNVATRAPLSREPLQVLYYRSTAFRERVERLLRGHRFDLAHAFFHRVAPYALGGPVPTVLDLMDSMQLRMERNAALAQPPKRWMFREELRRVRAYERELVERFDHVIVVSEQDRAYLPDGDVSVVFNGVDAEEFAPDEDGKEPAALIFSGRMSYDPNVHAVTWFVERCLPRIRAEVPAASLTIAGSSPGRTVQELARHEGVRVTGFVESMPKTLNRAAVAIAPMQSGSGIQNKILEAMACGLPVVTTTIGLGSIPALPGEEIVVADGEEGFAAAVVELLRVPDRTREVGRRAREFVVRRHSWEHAADEVDEIYRSVTDRRGR